jgi:hypothetical protein
MIRDERACTRGYLFSALGGGQANPAETAAWHPPEQGSKADVDVFLRCLKKGRSGAVRAVPDGVRNSGGRGSS